MDSKVLKKRIRILKFGSALYFFPAVLVHLHVLKEIFLPSGNFLTPVEKYREVYALLGDGGMGLLFVLFIVLFVSTIFVSNRAALIPGNSAGDKSSGDKEISFASAAGKIIMANIVIAFIWFGVMTGRVGGDLHQSGNNGYYVTYRGEHVKDISEQEYEEFREYKVKVITYLLSSIFLAFPGTVFLILYDLDKKVKERGNR